MMCILRQLVQWEVESAALYMCHPDSSACLQLPQSSVLPQLERSALASHAQVL